jgi:hypothetical protein
MDMTITPLQPHFAGVFDKRAYPLFVRTSILLICILCIGEQALPQVIRADYDQAGRELPPGVPTIVDTNGNVIYIQSTFTTRAYQKEALKLVVKEANQVAKELRLPEDLPITISNLVEWHVGPFGYNYAYRSVGSVTTSKYVYYVSQGDKFCYLDGTHQNEDYQRYAAYYTWPVSQIDTNLAYQLAAQWLEAASMDVKGLNRDCRVSITPDTLYIHPPPGKFVPVYCVSWIPGDGVGDKASVCVFAPSNTLISLRVEDPKYILRKPLVFTNLAALFPGVAPIRTNYPVKTVPGPRLAPN